MENNNEVKYAGFWVRLLAFIVDIFVVSSLVSLVYMIVGIEKFPIMAILILWLYFAISINRWRTTVGGKFLGIKIYTEKMNDVSFLKASVRFIVSIIPFAFYLYFRNMQHMMSPAPSPEVQMLPQLIFILLPLIMFFTKKRQMLHDILVKSVVIDVNKKVQAEGASPNKILYRGRMALRVIGVLLFLIVGGYVLLYTSVFYMLGKQSNNSYNNSFHMKYPTNDFNDSRIIFYKKELELYSKEFIEAEGMYDIFAADTKKDLALNCIQSALKEHNVTDWIEMGSGFRQNARNKFAISQEKINKAKANEDWMGHHFYDYDMNDVNSIESEIANIGEVDKNKNTCDKLVPASNLFDMFMVRYIPNRDNALSDYKREYKRAKPTGILNKSFYKREVSSTTQWVKTLHHKYPNIAQEVEALKQRQAIEATVRREQRKQKSAERKRELIWIAAEKNNLYGKRHYKNIDLNLRNTKGQTPLMIAVEHGFVKVVEEFSEGNVDVNLKDNQGNTAFDYIKKPKSREESMYSRRMYEALRILEVKQIIKQKAKMVQYSYNNDTDILSVTIKNEKCNDFLFSTHTECHELKLSSNDAIFQAIKDKDNESFDKLLPNLKDLSVRNKSNYTALWASIHYHNFYALEKLLDAGADMYALDQFDLKTPVYWAAMINDTKLLQVLLKHGADVDSKDLFGSTALSTAAHRCNNFEAIAILLDNGANPYRKDKRGETVFDKVSASCKDKTNREKMRKFLKERSNFSKE